MIIELWLLFGWKVGGRVGRDGFRSEIAFRKKIHKKIHKKGMPLCLERSVFCSSLLLMPIVVADSFDNGAK